MRRGCTSPWWAPGGAVAGSGRRHMYGHRHWPHPRGGDASEFAGRALGSPPPAAIGQRGSGVSKHDASRLSRGPKESCTRAARSPGCAFRRGGHPSDAVNLHVFEWASGAAPCRAAHRDCLRNPSPSGMLPEATRLASGRPQDQQAPVGRRAERKKAAHALVHELLAQGHSRRAIARHLSWGLRHRAPVRERHTLGGTPYS